MRRILTVQFVCMLLVACGGEQSGSSEIQARIDLGTMDSAVNRLLTVDLSYAPAESSLQECLEEIDMRLTVLDTLTTLDPMLRDSLTASYELLRDGAVHALRAVRIEPGISSPLHSIDPFNGVQRPPGPLPPPNVATTAGGSRVVYSGQWVEGPGPGLDAEIAETEQQLLMVRRQNLENGSLVPETHYLPDGSYIGANPDLARYGTNPVVFLQARLDSLRALRNGT